ncbi:translation initiation factor IF-2 isoform X1 [Sarcophilus harrisii]|uniref:translation initiation factor IF-2 isoform X1 n=1 Tax=Sarcophilus harrisii TaxID=9305 RepID=UPI001301EA07|nr:translation initiation factor IF-2 isoform X1 [Sarcophilus harrisii]
MGTFGLRAPDPPTRGPSRLQQTGVSPRGQGSPGGPEATYFPRPGSGHLREPGILSSGDKAGGPVLSGARKAVGSSQPRAAAWAEFSALSRPPEPSHEEEAGGGADRPGHCGRGCSDPGAQPGPERQRSAFPCVPAGGCGRRRRAVLRDREGRAAGRRLGGGRGHRGSALHGPHERPQHGHRRGPLLHHLQ